MKTSKKKSRIPLAAFETGQVWQLPDSSLHIGMIGKTLVHYKHFKVAAKRAPVSLCNKAVLERYLIDNEAVLVSA